MFSIKPIKMLTGLGFATGALIATGIDAYQNFLLGAETNELAAVASALLALMLMLLSKQAEDEGWSLRLLIPTILLGSFTFFCAVNYHYNSEGRKLQRGDDQIANYLAAQETLTGARARAEKITAEAAERAQEARRSAQTAKEQAAGMTEALSADALSELRRTASETHAAALAFAAAQTDKRCSSYPRCRTAEAALIVVTTRLGTAQRRATLAQEAALHEADAQAIEQNAKHDLAALERATEAARDTVAAGRPVPNALAHILADSRLGRAWTISEHDAALAIAQGFMIGRLLCLLAVSMLFGMGTRICRESVIRRPAKRGNTEQKAKSAAPKTKNEKAVAQRISAAQRKATAESLTEIVARAMAEGRKNGTSAREQARTAGISWSTFQKYSKSDGVAKLLEEKR